MPTDCTTEVFFGTLKFKNRKESLTDRKFWTEFPTLLQKRQMYAAVCVYLQVVVTIGAHRSNKSVWYRAELNRTD